MLYGIAFLIGVVLMKLIELYEPAPMGPVEYNIVKNVRAGKRVIVCIDADATIFEMVNGRVTVTKGVTDFNDLPVEK